mmetsp:Transcript_14389/g.31517  ORF Transcript_14389/g.31517 Transcript_14389/m.31517 type:complete len:118 (+) Transcript_14389:1129-1482(+)
MGAQLLERITPVRAFWKIKTNVLGRKEQLAQRAMLLTKEKAQMTPHCREHSEKNLWQFDEKRATGTAQDTFVEGEGANTTAPQKNTPRKILGRLENSTRMINSSADLSTRMWKGTAA